MTSQQTSHFDTRSDTRSKPVRPLPGMPWDTREMIQYFVEKDDYIMHYQNNVPPIPESARQPAPNTIWNPTAKYNFGRALLVKTFNVMKV